MGEMEKHIREALAINRQRAPLYNELSKGKSYPIHRKLIWGEWISIYTSKLPDLWASYFQKRGVPIVKEDFVSMDNIRPFEPTFPFTPDPITRFIKRDKVAQAKVLRDFKEAYVKGSFKGLATAVQNEIDFFHDIKTYHHMYRHVLESLCRIANLAPSHQSLAKKKKLFLNPVHLSKYLIFSHLLILKFAYKIDEELAPIQAQNIPILFNDLPYVPPFSDFYKDKD